MKTPYMALSLRLMAQPECQPHHRAHLVGNQVARRHCDGANRSQRLPATENRQSVPLSWQFKRNRNRPLKPYSTSSLPISCAPAAQSYGSGTQQRSSRSKARGQGLRPKALREPLSPKPRSDNMNLVAGWRALFTNAGSDCRVQSRRKHGFCRNGRLAGP